MSWADNIEMLQDIWQETGEKPAALANRPELKERWVLTQRVWSELSGSRNYTAGGLAEIPFSEFYLWAVAHEYTKAQMQSTWEDVHLFDKAWVGEHQKKASEEREAQLAKQKRTSSSPKLR